MKRSVLAGLVVSLAVLAIALVMSQGSSPSPSVALSPAIEQEVSMRISSPAFEDEGDIPAQYTCDGDDISPALLLEDVPDDTVSLVLVMDDPDAPSGTWDHWVVYDIAPLTEIPEDVQELGTAGANSWGDKGYGGPCPPSGTHRYFFRAFALDIRLGWEEGVDKTSVLEAIHGHVLTEATLLGFYSRE
jgi:hypothetical protein